MMLKNVEYFDLMEGCSQKREKKTQNKTYFTWLKTSHIFSEEQNLQGYFRGNKEDNLLCCVMGSSFTVNVLPFKLLETSAPLHLEAYIVFLHIHLQQQFICRNKRTKNILNRLLTCYIIVCVYIHC